MNVHVHGVRRRVGWVLPTALPRPTRALRVLVAAGVATTTAMIVLAQLGAWVGRA